MTSLRRKRCGFGHPAPVQFATPLPDRPRACESALRRQAAGSRLQIGNRIKAKGLGQLRWYCQMCQKQCRDENGFKCHLTSDAHRRQMEVFGQNPGRVIDGYSHEFHRTFIEHLNVACAPPPRLHLQAACLRRRPRRTSH